MKSPAISRELVFLGDFREEALDLSKTSGRTDLYSTGVPQIDEYLFGGYGRQGGYEIVVMYGDTGIGKSLVSLNFMASLMRNGVGLGLAVLEDSFGDVSERLLKMVGMETWECINKQRNIHCLPPAALDKPWTLESLLDYFEHWFTNGVDVVLLDHIQFAFENADSIRGENEYTSQRLFMRRLNALVKKHMKTVFVISHINKTIGGRGMQKIQGSGGIAGGATKVLELEKNDSGAYSMSLRKTRFTPGRDYPAIFRLDDSMRIVWRKDEQAGYSEKLF